MWGPVGKESGSGRGECIEAGALRGFGVAAGWLGGVRRSCVGAERRSRRQRAGEHKSASPRERFPNCQRYYYYYKKELFDFTFTPLKVTLADICTAICHPVILINVQNEQNLPGHIERG